MKTYLLIFAILLIGNKLIAQQQEQSIYNQEGVTQEIILDGNSSEWVNVPKIAIEHNFQNENPTLYNAIWSALWNDNGLYVLVEVSDDSWHPSWLSAVGWEHDRVEVYIDVSDPQQDGLGAKDMQGNYQISPNFSELDQGIAKEFVSEQFPEGNGILYADTYDDQGDYTIEYYIPYSAIPTKTNEIIDPWVTTVIGFDVTIIDVDSGDERNRAVWSNVGDLDESWNNCDQVGLITFQPEIPCKCDPLSVSEEKLNILKTNLNIDIIDTNAELKNLAIYNSVGIKIFEWHNKRSVDISALKEGVYIVKILDISNTVYTNKIIKY